MPVEDILSNILKMLKNVINVCVKAPQRLVNVYQLFSLRKHRLVWASFTETNHK